MSRNLAIEDDSLVCIESRCEDKATQDHMPISNDVLEKFYAHCSNIIKNAWKTHQTKKNAKPNKHYREKKSNIKPIEPSLAYDEKPIHAKAKQNNANA